MLGTGPMGDPQNPGCFEGYFVKWSETLRTMRVVLSNKVHFRMPIVLRDIFETYVQILGGRPSLEEEFVDVVPPYPTFSAPPQIGLITVDVADDLTRACGRLVGGCVFLGGSDALNVAGGIMWLRTGALDTLTAHEGGHMIGMCHIVGARYGETIMDGAISPTPLDREILEKVIRSGLRAGARRADFVAKGLL